MYKKVYGKMRVFALCAGKNMPHERGNFSPFVSAYKKSTRKYLRKCFSVLRSLKDLNLGPSD